MAVASALSMLRSANAGAGLINYADEVLEDFREVGLGIAQIKTAFTASREAAVRIAEVGNRALP